MHMKSLIVARQRPHQVPIRLYRDHLELPQTLYRGVFFTASGGEHGVSEIA